MRCCPRCGMPARAVGRVIATSSDDGQRHAVIGVCCGCTRAMERIASKGNPARWGTFLDRALADPDRYMVKLMPDNKLAEMVVAMCGAPSIAADTLIAIDLLSNT